MAIRELRGDSSRLESVLCSLRVFCFDLQGTLSLVICLQEDSEWTTSGSSCRWLQWALAHNAHNPRKGCVPPPHLATSLGCWHNRNKTANNSVYVLATEEDGKKSSLIRGQRVSIAAQQMCETGHAAQTVSSRCQRWTGTFTDVIDR